MNSLLTPFVFLQLYYPNIDIVLAAALKTTAIVLLARGAALCLKSRSARARCWIWRSALVALLGLVALEFGPQAVAKIRLAIPVQPQPFYPQLRTWNIVRSPEEVMAEERVKLVGINAPPWDEQRSIHITPESMRTPPWKNIEALILWVWGVGAAMLISFQVIRVSLGLFWLRRNHRPVDAATEKSCHSVSHALGLKRPPTVYFAPGIDVPLLVGIFRPTIYLPVAGSSWSGERLRSVFLHEIEHWRRRDNPWQYLGKLVVAIFWWNPVSLMAARQMRTEAEQAADDAVLMHGMQPRNYADTLVELASLGQNTPPQSAGVSMIGYQSLEKRIKALFFCNPWRGSIGKFAGLSILLTVLLFAAAISSQVSVASIMPQPGGASAKLNSQQRAVLQRIVAANERRLTALRYLHFTAEITTLIETGGETLVSPQPSKMEAWVDDWTGICRAEYHPRVTQWTHGAVPFYIEDATEINDGKKSYYIDPHTDLDRLQGHEPLGLHSYLGSNYSNDLIRIMKNLLTRDSLGLPGYRCLLDEETQDGHSLIRFREQIFVNTKMIQEQTFLVDPDHDDVLVSHQMGKSQWRLKEFGTAGSGSLYPAVSEAVHADRTDGTVTTKTAVTSLAALNSLPPGITELPKSQAAANK